MKEQNIPFHLPLVFLVVKLFLKMFSFFIVSNLCWLLSGLHLFRYVLLTGEFNSYSSAFFLFFPWTALLIVLLPLEVIRLSTGLLLLVALLCLSVFHMDRTKLPTSL